MERAELIRIAREKGLIGPDLTPGSVGDRLNRDSEILIINGAECQPLQKRDSLLLEVHALEILSMAKLLKESLHAERLILGIKSTSLRAIASLQSMQQVCPEAEIHLLPDTYPMGDEIELVYETTGHIVPPGKKPDELKTAVFGVETLYQLYEAVFLNKPVSSSFIMIAGEIERPIITRVPFGMTVEECVKAAGKYTTDHPVFFVGDPVFGRICGGFDIVPQKAGMILVLDETHPLLQKQKWSVSIKLKRTMASCTQCEMCTQMCPRFLMGYPLRPHQFMRAISHGSLQDMEPFLNTLICSSCGLCEQYVCPQGLSPSSLMAVYRQKLKAEGIEYTKEIVPTIQNMVLSVHPKRSERQIPIHKVESRLGLQQYRNEVVFEESMISAEAVRIVIPVYKNSDSFIQVQTGDIVKTGQQLAFIRSRGMAYPVFSSIDGIVSAIGQNEIVIKNLK